MSREVGERRDERGVSCSRELSRRGERKYEGGRGVTVRRAAAFWDSWKAARKPVR